MLEILGEADKATITIGDTVYKVSGEVERKVIHPTQRDDDYDPICHTFSKPLTAEEKAERKKTAPSCFAEPVDEVTANNRFMLTENETKRLVKAHKSFIQEVGDWGKHILTIPPENLIPRKQKNWIDWAQTNCNDWFIPLKSQKNGENGRLHITFLTSEGFLSALEKTHYDCLSYRSFNVSERLQLFTYSANGAAVDADGNTNHVRNALLIYIELEKCFQTIPAEQPPAPLSATADGLNKPKTTKPKKKNKSWPQSIQEKLGNFWELYRSRGGKRELDCYEAYKETNRIPNCITSFEDFKKCKEAAKKHGFIHGLNKGRGKSKGKSKESASRETS